MKTRSQSKAKIDQASRKRAARKVLSWWRVNSKTRGVKFVNDTDPITLEPVRGVPFVLHENAENFRFDPASLCKFIHSSKTSFNPLSRRKIHPFQVARLSRLASIRDDRAMAEGIQIFFDNAAEEQAEDERVALALSRDETHSIFALFNVYDNIVMMQMR